MDKIVKRLRAEAKAFTNHEKLLTPIQKEAADRIEQQDKMLTDIGKINIQLMEAVMELNEENKKLKAALRDPTLDMLIAGKKSLYSCSEDPELDDARKCFKAMVAALGGKKDG